MAKYLVYDEPIYSYYRDIIELNINSRKTITCNRLNSAINLNIILCSACFVEGFLEDRSKLLLGYYQAIYEEFDFKEFELRKAKNVFFNNVIKFLNQRISQSTGINNYNAMFELLTDASFKNDDAISPLIEGINVLYQFRNVIAHGRQIHLYEVDAYFTDGQEEVYNGGYKKAETYLIKKGLISNKIKDVCSSQIYFTNEIADHFNTLAIDFTKAFDLFLEKNMLFGTTLNEKLNKYNENNNTNLDMNSYLRNRGITPY